VRTVSSPGGARCSSVFSPRFRPRLIFPSLDFQHPSKLIKMHFRSVRITKSKNLLSTFKVCKQSGREEEEEWEKEKERKREGDFFLISTTLHTIVRPSGTPPSSTNSLSLCVIIFMFELDMFKNRLGASKVAHLTNVQIALFWLKWSSFLSKSSQHSLIFWTQLARVRCLLDAKKLNHCKNKNNLLLWKNGVAFWIF